MDYKKKLQQRLYVAYAEVAIGILLIAAAFIFKLDNYFFSSFGLCLAIVGAARVCKHRLITRDEETIRKQMIIETDERNLAIADKARSICCILYFLGSGIAVIVLSILGMHQEAAWVSYPMMLMLAVYFIAYWVMQKRI